MKYDKKIKSILVDIRYESQCYLDNITTFDECAYTDRIIEDTIEKAKELEKYHEKRFEIYNKENKKLDNRGR